MQETTTAAPPTLLLWTGGWDSTFRLLTLLLQEQRTVQPYYLVEGHTGRRSVAAERRAMHRIREQIEREYPAAAARLRDTIEVEVASIPRDPALGAHFARCVRHRFIGGQYEWLARFCLAWNIDGLELSIHRDDKARELLADLIDASRTRVDARFAGDSRYELFRFFRFPLFDVTKVQMRDSAEAAGFAHVMRLTWFCHSPRGAEPCGTCNPCIYTVEEGMGERLPRAALLRYRLRLMPRVKRWVADRPALYWRVRALKHPEPRSRTT